MSVGGKSMLRVTVSFLLYLEPIGFAAARIEVRAFSVVIIPAFAIETVCCSCKEGQIAHRGDQRYDTHHDFMQYTTGRIRHLVELIDATYTAVAENKGPTIRNRSANLQFLLKRPPYLSKTNCFESGSRVT